jgi:hypothetical protein
LSVGAGAGAAMAFGDLPKNYIRPVGLVTFDYHLTPHASLGVEIQKGFLKGGDSVNTTIDFHHRFYKNSYSALILNGKIELAQLVDIRRGDNLYALRGFYIGTGIGVVNSKMTEIKRTKWQGEGADRYEYTFPGADKGIDLLVPVNTGISFNFEDKWGYRKYALNFNYQLNMVLGEKIDGYDDPPSIFKNKHGDYLGVMSVGFKMFFGPEGIY